MNQFDRQWRKLTTKAREAGHDLEAAAPRGFAAQVVARSAVAPTMPPWMPFEYFAWRGLAVAAAFGVVAVASNFTGWATSTQTDAFSAADTVGELLELS